mmetsp:Transcript_128029/g.343554  ORF Transcript_128029/g.343554 Transcript_128029/m.343554 type:complete len:257 (+) Transcript_128029:797-1567(+)
MPPCSFAAPSRPHSAMWAGGNVASRTGRMSKRCCWTSCRAACSSALAAFWRSRRAEDLSTSASGTVLPVTAATCPGLSFMLLAYRGTAANAAPVCFPRGIAWMTQSRLIFTPWNTADHSLESIVLLSVAWWSMRRWPFLHDASPSKQYTLKGSRSSASSFTPASRMRRRTGSSVFVRRCESEPCSPNSLLKCRSWVYSVSSKTIRPGTRRVASSTRLWTSGRSHSDGRTFTLIGGRLGKVSRASTAAWTSSPLNCR